MARPGTKIYADASAVESSPGLRGAFLCDIVAILVAAIVVSVWGPRFVGIWDSNTLGIVHLGALLWCALAIWASVACLGLRPVGITWRRRLGLIAVAAVLWRGGPCTQRWFQGLVVIWMGAVMIATLIAARNVARAIVDATGEEGLGEDPSRHL